MNSDEPAPAPRLPAMKTFEDALALSKKQKDAFYLDAFMFQCWLGGLIRQSCAEYAEKKNPKDRSLQTGQALQAFIHLFGQPLGVQTPTSGAQTSPLATHPSTLLALQAPTPSLLAQTGSLLLHLFRFAEHDDPLAEMLRHALHPLSVEHDCTGDYLGPKTTHLAKRPGAGLELARRSLARWCNWLDALIHFQTHQLWHLAPACFDPDPGKRELAVLGAIQRHWGRLDAPAQDRWLRHFSQAAQQFKDSPKWPALGKAMSADSDRIWQYSEVDTLVISLWPLVKKHNWTYRDLLEVIRPGLKRPEAYPCASEQGFATYCANVLGLMKTGRGRSARQGRPAGEEIARRLCPGVGG